jgi:hypothetical protein
MNTFTANGKRIELPCSRAMFVRGLVAGEIAALLIQLEEGEKAEILAFVTWVMAQGKHQGQNQERQN